MDTIADKSDTTSLERCCWAGCRELESLTYFGRPLCMKHWGRLCALSETWQARHIAKMLNLPLERVQHTVDVFAGSAVNQ
jgi:hypothetical protein